MNAGAAVARACGVNNKPTTFVVFTTPVCPRRAPWQMEQVASALEELGVLEVADLGEVTGAQLDAMGMTVIQRKRLRRKVPAAEDGAAAGAQGLSMPASPSRKGAQGVSRPASPNRSGAE